MQRIAMKDIAKVVKFAFIVKSHKIKLDPFVKQFNMNLAIWLNIIIIIVSNYYYSLPLSTLMSVIKVFHSRILT